VYKHGHWYWLSSSFFLVALMVSFLLVQTPQAEAVHTPQAAADYNEFHLTAMHSGKCVEVISIPFLPWLTFMDGAPVTQSSCWGTANQTWRVLRLDIHGHVKVISKPSGKCMDVADSSQWPAASVIQAPCSPSHSQLWRAMYVRSVNGIPFYILQNRNSWHCLDVAWSSTTDYATVVQGYCSMTPNQLWDLRNLRLGYHGF
jgi:hypothetical protein